MKKINLSNQRSISGVFGKNAKLQSVDCNFFAIESPDWDNEYIGYIVEVISDFPNLIVNYKEA